MSQRRLLWMPAVFLLGVFLFTSLFSTLNYQNAFQMGNSQASIEPYLSSSPYQKHENLFSQSFRPVLASNDSRIENQNDISTGEIICFLHRKTAHIQINIEFVGTNTTNNSLFTSKEERESENTTLESIIVAGAVREVTIIEANNYTLQHTEIDLNGSTKIQFALTKPIPIGFSRNVRINFIQETTQVDTLFYYELGVDWLRRIGSQKARVIFDKGLSLINSMPKPHVISSIGDRLILSWFEVNRLSFSVKIDFSAPITLDNLIITPSTWSLGTIRRNMVIEQVFQVVNNENSFLEGSISAPDWIELNISHWSLAVGEQLYFKAVIHPKTIGEIKGNITLQSTLNADPVTIKVTGQIVPQFDVKVLLLITFGTFILMAAIITLTILTKKGKIASKTSKIKSKEQAKPENTTRTLEEIDLSKWREILTRKEFLIFEEICKSNGISQAEICRRTQLSKSTISRCVNRLVVKGLVKKEAYGMSNKISVNLAFFTKEQ